MAVFVETLFVTCLNVFLLTGAATADLSAKQKADMQVIPAPPNDVFKIQSLSRSIKHEAGDMELLAKDVVGRLNQINKVCFDIFQSVSCLVINALIYFYVN